MKYLFLLIPVIFSIPQSCVHPETVDGKGSQAEIFMLDQDLKEISGLTYSEKYGLWCIHDEKGSSYQLDLSTFDVIDEIELGKNQDFEGVEIIGDELYVISSSGDILTYNFLNSGKDKIKTKFDSDNNIEGLGAIASKNILLIGAKGDPLTRKTEKKNRDIIYGLDIKTEQLLESAMLEIDYEEIETVVDEKIRGRLGISGVSFYKGRYYILSHKHKLLLTYKKNGNLEKVEKLNPVLYNQAEGITLYGGLLLISNEKGNKNSATILIDQP